MTQESEAKTEAEIVGYFGKHLVALYFEFQKDGELQRSMFTAFVLSVSEHWFLLTAGHCLEQIEEFTNKNGYEIATCELIDYLGVGAKDRHSIPFPYDRFLHFPLNRNLQDNYWRHDPGSDYGIIEVSPFYRQLLQANGVEALTEEVWEKQPKTMDFCVLVGLPDELASLSPTYREFGLAMCRVEQLSQKPYGFADVDYPQFYGRILLKGLKSIGGMSGGPIFAFRKTEQGALKYWLIALQSRWLPKSHLIAACPTKLLGQFLKEVVIPALYGDCK